MEEVSRDTSCTKLNMPSICRELIITSNSLHHFYFQPMDLSQSELLLLSLSSMLTSALLKENPTPFLSI
jgi:hypothetical protein